jgi:hypothetical protein
MLISTHPREAGQLNRRASFYRVHAGELDRDAFIARPAFVRIVFPSNVPTPGAHIRPHPNLFAGFVRLIFQVHIDLTPLLGFLTQKYSRIKS